MKVKITTNEAQQRSASSRDGVLCEVAAGTTGDRVGTSFIITLRFDSQVACVFLSTTT